MMEIGYGITILGKIQVYISDKMPKNHRNKYEII